MNKYRLISITSMLALSFPEIIAAQNLFVADFRSLSIDEFTLRGIQSTFAPGIQPTGLAFDSAGNLLVSSGYTGGCIYKFTPNGTKSIFADGLNGPRGLAFDSAGDLFEADRYSGNIYKFAPDGTRSTFASGLNYPGDLAFDNAGNLFEGDWGSANVYKFAPDGSKSTFASLIYFGGLAFDEVGNLWVGEWGGITKITPDGAQSRFGYGSQAPSALAFDKAGNLFEADINSGMINKITPSGIETTFASGLYAPYGLAFQGITLPVPEPSACAIVGMGILALLGLRHKSQTVGNVLWIF